MSKSHRLEICAGSVISALAAQRGGADRVELCQNLDIGGTTPSRGQIELARAALAIGVHVLIRPRGGDFLYTTLEFEEMKADIRCCKEAGCDGVVFGILLADGRIDATRTAELVELARPLQVTFHRAFDCCRDPFHALSTLIDIGFDRLLTSGQQRTAMEGARLIAELTAHAGGRIEVMPGSGINAQNIARIARETGASSFHASAKVRLASEMDDRANRVTGMGDSVWVSSEQKIRRLADILKGL